MAPNKMRTFSILGAARAYWGRSGRGHPVCGDGSNVLGWGDAEDNADGPELTLRQAKPARTCEVGGLNEPASLDVERAGSGQKT